MPMNKGHYYFRRVEELNTTKSYISDRNILHEFVTRTSPTSNNLFEVSANEATVARHLEVLITLSGAGLHVPPKLMLLLQV